MDFDKARKEEIRQEIIIPAQNDYVSTMKSGDFYKVVIGYLRSKAYGNKVKTWILKRWSSMTDNEIVSDLMQSRSISLTNPKYAGIKANLWPAGHWKDDVPYKRPALYEFIITGKIEIIPLNILKKVSKSVMTESFMYSKSTNYDTILNPTTLKDLALKRRNTPEEYKSYLKSL